MVRFRPALVPTLMLIVMSSVMIYLGLWQKDRAVWKENLLANMLQKWSSPPEMLPVSVIRLKGDKDAIFGKEATLNAYEDTDLTLVEVKGTLLKEPFFFRPGRHAAFGKGFEVIAALKSHRPEEGIIPIALGVVPLNMRKTYQLPEGDVNITGMLRLPQPANKILPDHKDLVATVPFGSFYKLFGEELLPISVTATEPTDFGAYPKPRNTKDFLANIPNNHKTYMWTWFMLAGIMLLMYIFWHSHHGRLRLR